MLARIPRLEIEAIPAIEKLLGKFLRGKLRHRPSGEKALEIASRRFVELRDRQVS
jgi:hypothetical protein